MKQIIDIDEDVRIAISRIGLLRIPDEMQKKVDTAIQRGIPIPDNATNGDVIEKITNRKPLEDNKDANNIIISTKLWNAPYQKGGKNEQSAE